MPGSAPLLRYDGELAQAIDAAVGIGIAVVDFAGFQVHVNPAFCRMVGWTREELVGRQPPFVYWPAEEVARIEAVFQLAMEGRFPPDGVEIALQRRDGERFPVLLLVAPLLRDGVVIGWVGNVLDLSVQKIEAEALRRAEHAKRLGLIADVGLSGACQFDRAGRLLFVSDRFCELVQRNSDELVGRSVYELMPEEDRAAASEQMATALVSGNGFAARRHFRRPDGTTILVHQAVAIERDSAGEATGGIAVVVDVTGQEHAERVLQRTQAQLAEAEQRWQFALEGAGHGVWDWDIAAGRLYYSARYKAMLGYAPDGFGSSRDEWRTRLHPDDREPILDAVERLLRGDSRELDVEFRMRHRDGHYLWIHSRGLIVDRDLAGSARRMIGTHTDVTPRREAQDRLRASLEQLRLATDGARIGLWYWNIVDDTVECSALFREMLMIPEGQPPSMAHVERVVHPEDRERVTAQFEDALRRTAEYAIEYRIRRPDGTVRWIAATGRAYAGPDGRARAIGGVLVDITRQKDDADALQRMRSIMAEGELLAGLGSWEYVVGTGTTLWSEGEYRIYGLSSDRPSPDYATLLRDHIHPDDAAGLEAAFSVALGERGVFSTVNRIVRPDGEVRVTRNVGRPHYSTDGTLVRFLGATLDVTDAIATQERLHAQAEELATLNAELQRRADAADTASLAKSSFLANMSHEIRTPLNGVIGMAALIRQDGLTPRQQDRLHKLETAADHLLKILNAILDLSKIEAGKLELAQDPVWVDNIVSNTTAMLGAAVAQKGLRLVTDVHCPIRFLLGDETRLQQALLNYAGNALKFTERGTITIRAAVVEEDAWSATLRFEVEDTGIGVDADTLSRLFAPFEQADNSVTRKWGGTGLGLAITRRLAELMGGSAGATSVLGRGSAFWFTARLRKGSAPQVSVDHPEDHPAEALRREFSGTRLLVVDDNAFSRDVATGLLEAVGLFGDGVTTGRAAVEIALQRLHDVVLMDVQMPDVDGIAATIQIRKHLSGAELPVIAMTANAFDEDRALCMAAGMTDFIAKPFPPDEFYAAVLGALRRVRLTRTASNT